MEARRQGGAQSPSSVGVLLVLSLHHARPHADPSRFGVVHNGQKGITIVAPVKGTSDGTPKVVTIKPAWVFDVTQTDERTQCAAA